VETGLSLLVKPVSADCNMACGYCFYRRPADPYLAEGRHLMDEATLRAMVSGFMRSVGPAAAFGWQGGEPLLAELPFFERAVAFQQEYGLSGQLVGNNLQTNGLLLDETWARFFKKYNFFVGVSLDGPAELHDRYRLTAGGRSAFERTLAGIEALAAAGVDFSILSVVNDATAKNAAGIYDFFLAKGYDRLQFIPSLDLDAGGRVQPWSVSAESYRDFLCALFDRWYNGGRPEASIRLFENILAIYLGRAPEICAFHEKCGSYLVVEYNGDVYPCDFFVEKRWLIGNVRQTPLAELLKKRRRRDFNDRKKGGAPGCAGCEWNFICRWGCQHHRLPSGENALCGAYRDFFRHSRSRFEALRSSLNRRALIPETRPQGR
jgi:uncharacterized protein